MGECYSDPAWDDVLARAKEADALRARAEAAEAERDRLRAAMTGGVEAVSAERSRQMSEEGFTAGHDDQWGHGELARAAAAYILVNDALWPWHPRWWKPRSKRENLTRAGALVAAEIDRLDRLARAALSGGDDA